jgi:hydroxymethylbilane synthase
MSDDKQSSDPLRIATRGSPLALAQARAVAEAMPVPAELVPISTRGDRARGPLTEAGGKGLFTAELEAALRGGKVHLAVHSAKDLPAVMADDLVIAAVPVRQDPRDALVSASGGGLADLPASPRVGTGSPRRAAQVLAARPDARILPLRGNVGTRVRKLREGRFEAIVLAMAGVIRLGLAEDLAGMIWPLAAEDFVPAAGQGALAVQCLAADAWTREILAHVNDPASQAALLAERAVIRGLGADCRAAVGVHVWPQAQTWRGLAAAPAREGKVLLRLSGEGASADEVAARLLARLADSSAGGPATGG